MGRLMDETAALFGPVAVALAGMAALAVMMGIGRFAFTPIFPMMIGDASLSIAEGSALASANYAGNLLGALSAVVVRISAPRAIRWSLMAIGLTTLAMGFENRFPLWLALRAITGFATAWVLVFVSAWALEAKGEGIAGIVIWGLHRDSQEIREIGLPLFSLGALPTGPQRLDARPADVFGWATVGTHVVTRNDFVVADANGVLFLPEARLDDIIAAAVAIRDTERRQIEAMETGRSFRSQVRFSEYMSRRHRDASYSFRQHIKDGEAAGEE